MRPNRDETIGSGKNSMNRKLFLAAACAAFGFSAAGAALAQDSVKIGFILPMTGQQQSTGKQIAAGIKLYMAQNGDTVTGKKVELLIKDDGAVPDNTKRIAQEVRTDLDRSGYTRHHPERLYPQDREEERRTVQCRVRHFPERERSDQGCGEEVTALPA
jgi:hypothetical protein